MKKSLTAILTIVLLTIATVPNLAKDNTKPDREVIIANLMEGIKSDVEGLRVSCAYYLGEYKAEQSVTSLMRMLREEDNEGARLMAALSLVKIGDPQGIFMVKRTALFNDVARVRRMCDHLYKSFLAAEYYKENENVEKFLSLLN